MPTMSLKTKMTLAVPATVTVLLAIVGFLSLSYFEGHLRRQISEQQFTLVSAVAREFDQKIQVVQKALTAVAGITPAEIFNDPASAQAFLENRPETHQMFDNGLALFSTEGRLVAFSPYDAGIIGLDFSYREYFRKTMETGKPYISRPFRSSQADQNPVLMFTAPVFDLSGDLAGILAGSLNLLQRNLLGELGSMKVGKTGYLYLFDTERTMIVHPDQSRILKRDVSPGVNRMFDLALDGFEGSGETVNSRGLHALSSFKRLSSVDWILAANYPMTEAYEAIKQARHVFLGALVLLLLVSAGMIQWLMKRLTDPLLAFTAHMTDIADGRAAPAPFATARHDEIGTLARAFNDMSAALQEKGERLQEQFHFLQVLIDAIPNPVFYKDTKGRYLGSNKAFAQVLDMGREELVGRTAFDIVPAQHAAAFERIDAEMVGQTPDAMRLDECVLKDKQGDEHDVLIYRANFPNPDGTLGGSIGVLVDITDRKRAEAEVEKQRRFAESLLQNCAVPAFVLDADHRVLIWNRACEELTGVEAAKVLGTREHWRPFYAEQRPLLADLVLDGRHEALSTSYHKHGDSLLLPEGVQAEGWYPEVGGEARYMSFEAAPVRDAAGEVLAVIETLQDITARKRDEERLLQQAEALAAANEEIKSFAYIISHDLRAPLVNIRGFSAELRYALAPLEEHFNDTACLFAESCRQLGNQFSSEVPEALDFIESSVIRMDALISAILNLSRLGHRTLQMEPVDTGLMVAGIVKSLTHQMEQRQVTANIAALPVVAGDRTALEQIFGNLLDNAVKYLDHERPGRIDIEVEETGELCTFHIQDNGRGIAEADMEKVFEVFRRAGRQDVAGEGMGLAYVRSLVRRLGGSIWCRSQLGEGAIFSFSLPRTRGEYDRDATQRSTQ